MKLNRLLSGALALSLLAAGSIYAVPAEAAPPRCVEDAWDYASGFEERGTEAWMVYVAGYLDSTCPDLYEDSYQAAVDWWSICASTPGFCT